MFFISPPIGEGEFLVAPGFRPASGVTLSLWSIFLKFQNHIPNNMGPCKSVFKDATNMQNGCHGTASYFFVGAKLKSEAQNLSLKLYKFYDHIPHDMDVHVILWRFYWN